MSFKLTLHAIQRMGDWHARIRDLEDAIQNHVVIEEYPEDTPYPSRLVLAHFGDGRPLHMVIAEVPESAQTIVVTLYQPDPTQWEDDFRRRRS